MKAFQRQATQDSGMLNKWISRSMSWTRGLERNEWLVNAEYFTWQSYSYRAIVMNEYVHVSLSWRRNTDFTR